ncbi:MAG: redoxin domain-containing protein [Opitutales bacterium]
MKFSRFLLSLAVGFGALSLSASVNNGETAPDFTLETASGEKVSLSDFRGQYVVLEWVNPGCPFVQKFYNVGAMQRFQKQAEEMGAVWLAINSTTSSHRDYLDVEATQAYIDEKDVPVRWLLDESGDVGRMYDATRTPHCYVIDPEGTLIYQGAIDSVNSANPKDIDEATNYVLAALKAAKDGDSVPNAETRPYGCTIKY